MSETLGDRLKRIRSSRKLGLRETALKVGISATYLSRVENNQESSPPSEEKIRALSCVLEDNFDELMQLAGRVSSEVTDLIKADLNMPAFLRRAREKNLTAEELMKLLDKKDNEGK
jgi:transcriptional regulator with XRE-family HTH domain